MSSRLTHRECSLCKENCLTFYGDIPEEYWITKNRDRATTQFYFFTSDGVPASSRLGVFSMIHRCIICEYCDSISKKNDELKILRPLESSCLTLHELLEKYK